MNVHSPQGSPVYNVDGSPIEATTILSEQDKMISRFVLPLIVSVAAHIFLPPLPAAIVTAFCLLSALAPGASRPRIIIARYPLWNP